MRVGLFSDTYVPDANGVAICVENLKKALEEKGIEVFVITCNDKVKVEIDGNIIKLPSIKLKKLYNYSFTGPLHFDGFKIIKNLNLDIIHVHTEFGIALLARFIAKKLEIPLIYTYHTMFEDYTHYINPYDFKLLSKSSHKIVEYISNKYCQYSNKVIIPSKKTYDVLKKYKVLDEKMVILPSGINLSKFSNVDKNKVDDLKNKYNLINKKVFVYVGRIAKEKNLEIILNVFSKRTDLTLLLVGLGPELEFYKMKYNKDNILFLGKKEYTEVPLYYNLSNAFISASKSETQGLTFIEAMASSKVLFCSDKNVLKDLLYHNENGYFFDDENQLEKNIDIHLKKTESEIRKMEEKSKEISNKYSLENFVEKVIRIYEKNLGRVYRIRKIKHIKNEIYKIKIRKKEYVISKKILNELNLYVSKRINENELNTIVLFNKLNLN